MITVTGAPHLGRKIPRVHGGADFPPTTSRVTSYEALLVLVTILIQVFPAAATAEQAPPSRPTVVGTLELVASLTGDQPAGIAVSNTGRLFVTYPRHDGDVKFTVGEIKRGAPVAFPSPAVNHASVDRPDQTLFSVQTLRVDASDHLWMLDTGTLQFGEPPVPGAVKLVELDLKSDRLLRKYIIPPTGLVPQSALKDFRIDVHRGRAGTVFITDSAPGAEAFIVLDLYSGQAFRRLTGDPSVSAIGGLTPIVGFEPLMERGVKPWLVGLNALELSADGQSIFFSAFTGRRLYSVGAADLANPSVDNRKLADSVKQLGDIGMAGHFALDKSGVIYFMDMEHDAIYRRTQSGHVTLVVTDTRLMWPDTMAIGRDKYLYVTTSQHDRRAEFHEGHEMRQLPYGLYRVFVDADPVISDAQ